MPIPENIRGRRPTEAPQPGLQGLRLHCVVPLMEEAVFKSVPLAFGRSRADCGKRGLGLHASSPAIGLPLSTGTGTKAPFTILDTMFYGLSAVFYGILWISAGLIAMPMHAPQRVASRTTTSVRTGFAKRRQREKQAKKSIFSTFHVKLEKTRYICLPRFSLPRSSACLHKVEKSRFSAPS